MYKYYLYKCTKYKANLPNSKILFTNLTDFVKIAASKNDV